jgi:DNA adenine methylase
MDLEMNNVPYVEVLSGGREHNTQLEASTAPFLRWAGSKRKLLPQLLGAVPCEIETYYEPFAGSACLFFALKPRSAVLSDINEELIRAYRVVKARPRRLWETIARMSTATEYYYYLRSLQPSRLDEMARAARFIYLSRFCFNGVFRTNKAGKFNVPRGRKTGDIPAEIEFRRCSQALRGATLVCGDFEQAVSTASMGDFVYLDPPYAKRRGRHRGEYGYNGFALTDVPRLARLLDALDKRKARFLMSYAFCSEIAPLMEAWNTRSVLVRRHVAGFSDERVRVREVLLSNY